jgi:O-antigen/teichoic acid export membrane protein
VTTPPQSLAQRSVTSASWNVASNVAYVAISFVRTWLLARWLPVDVFGIYALASSIVSLSGVVANFGMGGAFLHRAPENEDEGHAAAIHFTLKSGFTLAWAAIMIIGTLVFSSGATRLALLVIIATASGTHLAQTPYVILIRRVQHRRLAILQLCDASLSTVLSLALASQGVTLWALLASNIVSLVLNGVFFYVWRPIWRPRLAWSPQVVRYFLRFGSRNLISVLLSSALDRVDDLWTGFALGSTALGFYSRAYAFATYPRTILADPIRLVAEGTYAELKGDRRRLSASFDRTNAFLIRSGFLLAGMIALAAPEFTRIVLGERWLPMLDAFRLMLVFTLFDPMKTTVSNLFVVMGRPEQVVRIQSIQLAVMVVGLFALGPLMGIAGVALAVDAMLVVGIIILMWRAREYVDFSIKRLFAAPGLALLAALLVSYEVSALPVIAGSDWRTGAVKIGVFLAVYGAILWILEHRLLSDMLATLVKYLPVIKSGD